MEIDTLTNLSGTAQKNIPGIDFLKAMPFPIRTVAEQRRIVAKVDKLIAPEDQPETEFPIRRTTALLKAVVVELTGKE